MLPTFPSSSHNQAWFARHLLSIFIQNTGILLEILRISSEQLYSKTPQLKKKKEKQIKILPKNTFHRDIFHINIKSLFSIT